MIRVVFTLDESEKNAAEAVHKQIVGKLVAVGVWMSGPAVKLAKKGLRFEKAKIGGFEPEEAKIREFELEEARTGSRALQSVRI